jgi:hypothetical protein
VTANLTSGPLATPATFSLTTTGVSGISPASGDTAGGTSVTLTGAGFGTSATTQVFLDGSALPAASIESVTDTRIVYIAPAHAAGSVTVTVQVSGTALAGSATYTYGTVAPLPGAKGSGGTGGSPPALPAARPLGTSGGTAPNPLPSPRP